MKLFAVFAVLAICVSPLSLAQVEKKPTIEPGIYEPKAPFENIKQRFYVRERERPLLDAIMDASTSITFFLIDVTNASSAKSESSIRQVLGEARNDLRLPPIATFDKTNRYVGLTLYCWKSTEKNSLEFLIEWADITTNARYTDSYIFVRRGPSWYFERHGSTPAWHWTQTERYFQRACPSIPTE